MQPKFNTTTLVETDEALSALTVTTPGVGSLPVPALQLDVALTPGVTVMVQLELGGSVLGHVLLSVVPAGQLGDCTTTFSAFKDPVFVMVIVRAVPLAFSARSVTLADNVVSVDGAPVKVTLS